MGAVCGTQTAVQPEGQKDGGGSTPASGNSSNGLGATRGHKESLENWLKDIKCGDVTRNLHDFYTVDVRDAPSLPLSLSLSDRSRIVLSLPSPHGRNSLTFAIDRLHRTETTARTWCDVDGLQMCLKKDQDSVCLQARR